MPLPRLSGALSLMASVALATLVGCAQSAATTNTATPTATQPGSPQVVTPTVSAGPLLDTIEVWMAEHGILVWTPHLTSAGLYQFDIENLGAEAHDFTIVRAGSVRAIPDRRGRALLQSVPVIARSPVIAPEGTGSVQAVLDTSGTYVVLSGQGTDFGDGMSTLITVGAASEGRPAPQATPPADEDKTVHAYLLDHAVFLHDQEVDAGIVRFNVQNLGPNPHDFVVVQWRGDATALPVDASGDVLLDGLIVLDRLPPLAAGETATLDVEMDDDLAYVVFSSLPGDYQVGMAAQVMPR